MTIKEQTTEKLIQIRKMIDEELKNDDKYAIEKPEIIVDLNEVENKE